MFAGPTMRGGQPQDTGSPHTSGVGFKAGHGAKLRPSASHTKGTRPCVQNPRQPDGVQVLHVPKCRTCTTRPGPTTQPPRHQRLGTARAVPAILGSTQATPALSLHVRWLSVGL